MPRSSLVLTSALIACAAMPVCAADAVSAPPSAHPTAVGFVTKYCFDCHAAEADAKRLRIDRLSSDFADAENADSWIAVLDKVIAREMPPADQPQPTGDEIQSFVKLIGTPLQTAQLAKQRAEGRVVLRRLNRFEYEQTVNDLLSINVPLAHLLPEDGSAFGFNNIGSALNTSSQLLERHLEAADVALRAAILTGPRPETLHKTYRFVEEPQMVMLNEKKKGDNTMFVMLPDAYVMYSDRIPYGGGNLGQFRAPSAGRYRVRITAYGHRAPVTMRVYAGKTRETPHHLVGHYDLPADTPTVIEFEDEFPANSSLSLQPYRLKPIAFNGAGKKLIEYPGLALQTAEVEGPLWPEWPPESYRKLFGELDLNAATAADVEPVLKRFLPRAFRRPVTDAEVRPYVELVQSRLEQKADFKTAIRLGLQAALCSPKFLFLDEKPGPLSDVALASRLSYFLWSSLPDDELTRLAGEGKLSRPDVLHGQVERMLADPKAERFVKNFLGQWLDLRLIEDTTPDKFLYPEFDELLQASMIAETEQFFKELLRNDLSVANFVDSDFAMLNERLAKHYGIDGIVGQEVRKVSLPPGSHRGGVLTQAGVLKVTANGTNTSPVVRGVWVLENILGQPIPPPPPDVPAVEPDIRGAVTIREQLEKHRRLPACASCHDKIDPPGFALENFDVIGGRRERYRSLTAGDNPKVKAFGQQVKYLLGREVDAGDELADGRRFANLDELKTLLLTDKRQLARCVVGKLLTYATGGGPQFADRAVIDEIVERASKSDYGLRTILHQVVQSPAFLSK